MITHTSDSQKLLDKMYKYKMDPTKTIDATKRTRDAGWTDGLTDGRMDRPREWYTPTTSSCVGYNNGLVYWHIHALLCLKGLSLQVTIFKISNNIYYCLFSIYCQIQYYHNLLRTIFRQILKPMNTKNHCAMQSGRNWNERHIKGAHFIVNLWINSPKASTNMHRK